MKGVVSQVSSKKTSKGYFSRTMRRVNSRSSRCNLPSEALHVGASSVALRPQVPDISEITDGHTDTHTNTQITTINIIDTKKWSLGY